MVSITSDSVNACDWLIEIFQQRLLQQKLIQKKVFQRILTKKKVTYKIENLYILFTFLTIIVSLLINISIYCCLIKHLSWQQSKIKLKMSNKWKK